MSDIVNQIDIVSVQTSIPADRTNEYAVSLSWTLNGGYSCPYKGEYKITLYEDSIVKITKSFTDTLGNKCTVLSFPSLTLGKQYSIAVAVPEAQGGRSSGKESVLIDYCKELSGTFNGEVFEIFWKCTTTKIPIVQCTMSCPNKVNNVYSPCTSAGHYRFSSIDFAPNDIIDVNLMLTDSDKSVGPASRSLRFYAAPLSILALEASDLSSASKLKITLKSSYTDISKVNIYFKTARQVIACIADVAIAKQADGNYLLEKEIPHAAISFEALTACAVYCTITDHNAESRITDAKSIMPAASPRLCVDDITKDKINMSVRAEGAAFPPIGYELPDGTMLNKSTYSVAFDKTFSLKLRPRYDLEGLVRKGPASNTVSAFRSGYYPSETTGENKKAFLQLYQDSFTEKSVSHSFTFELFKNRLTEKIEIGSLKLEVLNDGYKLTVNNSLPLTSKDYSEFLAAVKDHIKPYGFYCLCDSILRIAPQQLSDTLNLLCAFHPKERTADLRPGLILNLSTSVYQPQYDPKIPNTAGYSSMYSSAYPVSMCSNGTYLAFDRYSAAIAENMNISSLPNQSTKIIFASSIYDMLQPAVKQPYYRVLYPNQITHDYSTETPYPSDNMVILTADSYGAILTACESIKSNPAAINNLSIPVVIFKGRSTLSILMPVIFNNQRITVPVGSTIQDVLQQYGLYNSQGIKLYRRSADGSELPVFLPFSSNPHDISLISGDRITLA